MDSTHLVEIAELVVFGSYGSRSVADAAPSRLLTSPNATPSAYRR